MFAHDHRGGPSRGIGKHRNDSTLRSHRSIRIKRQLGLEALEARCLLSGNPSITEFTVPAEDATPTAITAGPDGNIWFTAGSQVFRSTPDGQVTGFSLGFTPDSIPGGITAGPDGGLWFTDQNNSQIDLTLPPVKSPSSQYRQTTAPLTVSRPGLMATFGSPCLMGTGTKSA